MSQHVHRELVVTALGDGERGGSVAVSRRAVHFLAVLFGFFGHVDHKCVFDFVVVTVSAARDKLVVKRIVVVVPLALVGIVEGFVEADCACGDVVLVVAGGVGLAARPGSECAGVSLDGCVNDFEVAVGDEKSLGGFDRRRFVVGIVVVAVFVASDKHCRRKHDECDHQ